MPTLQTLVPGAQLTIDARNGRLVAWATDADQAALARAIEKLQADQSPQNTPQLEVYRLTKASPATTQTLLTTLVPDAKITLDAPSQSLFVLATPADQRTIRSTLEQLQPAEPRPDAPELRFYPLTQEPPSTLVTGLQTLVPKAQITLEAGGKRLMVIASPEDHDAIQAALERIEKNVPGGKSRFEVYRVRGVDAANLLTTLQTLVPTAKLTVDAKTNNVVAWATDEDHERLKAAVGKLGQGEESPLVPRPEVYHLTKVDPATTLTLLQSLVPRAQFTLDSATRRLVAVAMPEDHEKIRALLERLQTVGPAPDAPELRFYPLAQTPSPGLVPGLTQLAPKAQITLDAEGKRLMVVASPEDHKTIKATIDRVEASTPPEEPRQLKTYAVTEAAKKRFTALLPNLATQLPGVQVIPETEPGELSIWAKPTQHAILADIVKQLASDAPEGQKYQLVAYPLKSADPTSVLTVMKSLFPTTQIVLDPKTRRLAVWASPAEHEKIKAAVEQMDSGVPADAMEKVMVYPLKTASPAMAMQVLQQLVPEARLMPDAAAGTIVAWARGNDQKVIAKTLEELQSGVGEKDKPRLEVYPAGSGNAASMVTILTGLVPTARIVPDTTKNTLAVWATPEEHEKLRGAIEKMAAEESAETAPTVATYELHARSPYHAIQMLRTAAPQAAVGHGDDERQLIVWARPAEQKIIKQIVEQLAKEESGEKAARLGIYQLESTPATTAAQIFRQATPTAQFSFGTDPRQLIVWATPEDHEKIKIAVAELAKSDTPPTMAIYTLANVTAAAAMPVVRQALPQVQVTQGTNPNQLVVWANPADHAKVKAVIDKLSAEEPAETAPTMVVYTLANVTAAAAMPVVRQAVPDVQLSPGANPNQLVVWARPADHAKVKAAIDKLSEAEPAETAPKMVIYTLANMTTAAALPVLREAAPQAQLSYGAQPNQLVVWARPADHEKVKTAIAELTKQEPPETAPTVQIYTLDSITAASVLPVLQPVVPQALLNVGSNPQQLVARARPAEHKLIKTTLDELTRQTAGKNARKPVVYKLQAAPSYMALRSLSDAFPQAIFAPGTDPRQLIAWATKADHVKIKALIDEISKPESPETAPKAVVYPLESTTASGAIAVLSTAFPDVRFSVGSDPYQLIAMARPAEHALLKTAIEEMTKEGPAETASTMVVYTLESGTVYGRSPRCRRRFPGRGSPRARTPSS